MEVIKELDPLHPISLSIRPEKPISHVTLEPQGESLPHTVAAQDRVQILVKSFTCHQMVVLHEV